MGDSGGQLRNVQCLGMGDNCEMCSVGVWDSERYTVLGSGTVGDGLQDVCSSMMIFCIVTGMCILIFLGLDTAVFCIRHYLQDREGVDQ